MSKRRKIAVWALVVVASLLALISSFTVWTKRQLLNTDAWTRSSSQVLADPTVRDALANRLVTALYQRVDVTKELQQALPPAAQGVAPAAAAALQTAAVRATEAFLATPQAQKLWEDANRRAHTRLVQVLEGKSVGPLQTSNGDVVLDVRPMISSIADRLGVGDRLRARAGPNAGQIVLMRSDQLKAAQDAVQAVKVLSVFIAILVLVLYGLAIYLARGSRRVVLEGVGVSLIIVGLLLAFIRRIVGREIVNSLVQVDSSRPAVHHVWLIETVLMRDIAIALLVYGVCALVAGWLSGPSRPAVWVRRTLTPTFEHHPVVVYLVALVVFLLIVAWGPTGANRQLLGTVILAALVGVGLEIWRRQSIREFGSKAPPPKEEEDVDEVKPALT